MLEAPHAARIARRPPASKDAGAVAVAMRAFCCIASAYEQTSREPRYANVLFSSPTLDMQHPMPYSIRLRLPVGIGAVRAVPRRLGCDVGGTSPRRPLPLRGQDSSSRPRGSERRARRQGKRQPLERGGVLGCAGGRDGQAAGHHEGAWCSLGLLRAFRQDCTLQSWHEAKQWNEEQRVQS